MQSAIEILAADPNLNPAFRAAIVAEPDPKCQCGCQADWDGEICYTCRDERLVDAEMFARGIGLE